MNSLEPSHLPQVFILVLLLLVGYVLQFVLKVQSFAFLVLILLLMSIFGNITATVIILCLWKSFISFTGSQKRSMRA